MTLYNFVSLGAHDHSERALRVELWRGEVLESAHSVHAALVDESGALIASLGDPQLVTTGRSALKPFQLWSGLRRGVRERYQLSDAELALMCASHNGEPRHVALCEQLLERLGKGVEDLECGAHAPYHAPSAEAVLRAGGRFTAAHNNCSGKHCGMLALSAQLDASASSYLSLEHPSQQAIFEDLRRLLGEERAFKVGTDGCSLPTPALSLSELARLFARLAAGRLSPSEPQDQHLEAIFKAMSGAPELVAGEGRFDSAMMSAMEGALVCKVGGEAVRGFALRAPDGSRYGLALKVVDGAMRALHPACLATLARCGFIRLDELPARLARFINSPEQNWRGFEATELRVSAAELS